MPFEPAKLSPQGFTGCSLFEKVAFVNIAEQKSMPQ